MMTSRPQVDITFPLPAPWCERITQKFGERPGFYARWHLRGHNGIDFSAPVGTPVLACDDGIISQIRHDPEGFGLYVKVKHTWGYSLYAHLLRNRSLIGRKVSRGEEIALSGNSGTSSGPHLHFGVQPFPIAWQNGWNGYIDPMSWFGQ